MPPYLTTGACAALINAVIDMPGAYKRDYIRQEVEAGDLVARVFIKVPGKKAIIKIHPADFLAWARLRLRDPRHLADLERRLSGGE
jgi:hypothetical protein